MGCFGLINGLETFWAHGPQPGSYIIPLKINGKYFFRNQVKKKFKLKIFYIDQLF
jgi:hypothetical protein